MRVSSRPNSPRGRGENDAIVTGAEPRFLLRHSRSRPRGLFGREGTRIQRLSYLENGHVRAGDRYFKASRSSLVNQTVFRERACASERGRGRREKVVKYMYNIHDIVLMHTFYLS